MKKIFACILVAAIACISAFADVEVKKLENGRYEVNFIYKNPRAEVVYLSGNFTNWGDGYPMEKTERGYELSIYANAQQKLVYKFISDGVWTYDVYAPDAEGDGFGGKNGVVVPYKVMKGTKAKKGKK